MLVFILQFREVPQDFQKSSAIRRQMSSVIWHQMSSASGEGKVKSEAYDSAYEGLWGFNQIHVTRNHIVLCIRLEKAVYSEFYILQ